MFNRLLITIIFLNCLLLASVHIEIDNISSDGTVTINYESDTDIAGLQFTLMDNPDIATITGAGGGAAVSSGFTVSTSPAGTVLGFSFTGSTIPAGSGHLLDVYLNLTGDSATFTLDQPVFSNSSGQAIETTTGDPYVFGGGVQLSCEDATACNFMEVADCVYPEENYDCDGNFIATMVQVIHNSASPTVDVYVNGELAIENFTYRSATPVLTLPTSFTVGIAPADADVIAEFPFDLAEGGSYVVVATGLLGDTDTPFNLAATGTTFGASNSNVVGLEVYHGSTDAPAVDVYANDALLLSSFSYGDFSGFVEVPAVDYVLGIAPASGDVIASFSAPLSGLGGGSAVVFASGFLSGDDQPLDWLLRLMMALY